MRGAATSVLDGDAEREENLFIPPPVLKMRGDLTTTKILPPTDLEPIENPFPAQPAQSWRRAFLAGGVLGGLVVGALSFRADVARFVASRLHKTPAPQSVAAEPAPVPAAAVPAPTAPQPAPAVAPAPAPAAVVEEHVAAPPAAAAAEAAKPIEEPAVAAGLQAQRKTPIAGDRRAPIRSTRLLVRPGVVARRRAPGARAAAAPGAAADTAAPAAKGDDWVDPFSDGTWTKIPSDQ